MVQETHEGRDGRMLIDRQGNRNRSRNRYVEKQSDMPRKSGAEVLGGRQTNEVNEAETECRSVIDVL